MRVIQPALIATMLFAAATVFGHEPPKKAPAAAAANDPVAAVLLRNAEGFETGDLAMLDTLWANEENVTVFESGYVGLKLGADDSGTGAARVA